MFRSLAIVLALSTIVTAKDVTLLVIEKLNAGRKGPPYDNTVIVMNLAEDAKLIDVMNKAQIEGIFSFNYTMHHQWGAYITTVNGLYADSTAKQYWQIMGGPRMKPTQLGASSYVPADHEKVIFRLVTWDREPCPDPTDDFENLL